MSGIIPETYSLPKLGIRALSCRCEGYHIVGWLITALYYNNLGYVLAQVVSLVFCKQNARSKLLEYTICWQILYSPPVPKHNLDYCNRDRWSVNPVCDNAVKSNNNTCTCSFNLVDNFQGVSKETRLNWLIPRDQCSHLNFGRGLKQIESELMRQKLSALRSYLKKP